MKKNLGFEKTLSPAIAHFHELVLNPATTAPHRVLHFGLHAEHLVLGHALLPLHFGVRRYPIRGPGHLAFTGVREIRILVAGENFLHHLESRKPAKEKKVYKSRRTHKANSHGAPGATSPTLHRGI